MQVRDRLAVEQAINETVKCMGRLNVLVANAGAPSALGLPMPAWLLGLTAHLVVGFMPPQSRQNYTTSGCVASHEMHASCNCRTPRGGDVHTALRCLSAAQSRHPGQAAAGAPGLPQCVARGVRHERGWSVSARVVGWGKGAMRGRAAMWGRAAPCAERSFFLGRWAPASQVPLLPCSVPPHAGAAVGESDHNQLDRRHQRCGP